MDFQTRLILLSKAINDQLLSAPLFAILIGAIFGAVGYGGVMSLLIWLIGIADGTASWAALLFGFPAVLLIPSSIDKTWSTHATLILIFFVQGALLGGFVGLLARSVCLRKFPQSDAEDDLN